MIQFDEHGHLLPYQEVEITLDTLEVLFVQQFPNSQSRRILFENYVQYIQKFQNQIFPFFEQWINGSFITRKENPKDIDIVTFLDHQVFELKERVLHGFLSFSLEKEGIDAYIVPEYPENHVQHSITKRFRDRWRNRFQFAKANENDIVLPKGFIKINFEK